MTRRTFTTPEQRLDVVARNQRLKLRREFAGQTLIAPTNHAFCVAITPPGADAQRGQQIIRRSI
jgi:hypothetical protein